MSLRPASGHSPPKLRDAHRDILSLCHQIDGHQCDLAEFVRRLLLALLKDGAVHIQIDRPRDGGRPYFILRPSEQLIGARADENGHLQDFRLAEKIIQPHGQFGEREVEVIRYFNATSWSVWQSDTTASAGAGFGRFRQIAAGQHDLGVPPLISLYALPDGFMSGRPPLLDLAWLNLAHWQSSSDQRHILHVARVPLLFGRALQVADGTLEIGPNRLVLADDPAAELKFIEHSGAAIEAGRQDLLDLEDKMAVMGLELLTHRTGQQTATGRKLDAAQNHAALNSVLNALESGLTRAFALMASWLGLPEEAGGQIELSRAWQSRDNIMEQADWLLTARQAGEITPEQFLREIRRHGLLSPDQS